MITQTSTVENNLTQISLSTDVVADGDTATVIAFDPRKASPRKQRSTPVIPGHKAGVALVDAIDAPVVTDFYAAREATTDFAKTLVLNADKSVEEFQKAGEQRLRALAEERTEVFHINPMLILIRDAWNCRLLSDPANLEHIDDLARSIASIPGVQDPLTVVFDKELRRPVLTDGHMRLLATFRAISVYGAKIMAVPVRQEARFTNEEDHLLRQILVGKQKSPLEMFSVFVRLIKSGWSVERIANSSGLTKVRVSQVLDVCEEMPKSVYDMVAHGRVAFTLVQTMLRDADKDWSKVEALLKDGAERLAATTSDDDDGDKPTSKARVTAKNIAGKQSLRAIMREIMGATTTEIDETSRRGKRILTISAAHFKQMMEEIGLG